MILQESSRVGVWRGGVALDVWQEVMTQKKKEKAGRQQKAITFVLTVLITV